jgi:succinate dehydrogenase / fumarate reductase, cytochrome b subunit
MATPVSPSAESQGSSSSSPVKGGVPSLRAGKGHEFLLRRLHSLSGIIPVGAFLLEHILVSNATAINGPTAYYNQVKFLNSLPLVLYLEIFGIWIPILFHGVYGFYIWYRGQSNVVNYPWEGNWMYALQRWTGGIAFVYIVVHTYTMRFAGIHLPGLPAASFGKVQRELANNWMLAFWIIGLVTASWHFAYGIWLFAAKWGITIGERARRRFLVICMGLFALLLVVGGLSIRSFRVTPLQPIEQGPELQKLMESK